MTSSNFIEKSYHIIKEHFQNTRILDFEQLLYLLVDQFPQEELIKSQEILYHWFNNFINYQYISKILKTQPRVTEIFLTESPHYKTSDNRAKIQLEIGFSLEYLQLHLEILAHKNQQDWNFNLPFKSFFCDFLKSKSRVTLIHKTLSPKDLSSAFIRVIPAKVYSIDNYSHTFESTFFKDLVSSKKNILISGSTGSGKTSFLSSLLQFCSPDEHIVTLEDTKEIISSANTTELLSTSHQGKTMQDLCSYVLRMSPNRVILGEMRSHEVIPFFLMMNTGHKGLMSTIHSNSAIDAIHRCSFLFSLYSQGDFINYNQSLKMISQNIDYVIFLENKKVSEIIKVLGSEKGDCFYEQVSPEDYLSSDFFIRDSFRNQCINS